MSSTPHPPGRGSVPPPAATVDARGLLCPLPVLEVARRLERLRVGERLELLGDDLGILEDLPAWCRRTGHLLVEIASQEGTIRALVERSGGPSENRAEP